MKHPFWLLNSILLLLLCSALAFMIFARPKLPRRVPFEPTAEAITDATTQKETPIDLNVIINNDIFGTSAQRAPVISEPQAVKPMPQPPLYRPVVKAPAPLPHFLEPLQVTLRGIIITGDERFNIAILRDNKTKTAKNYKLGDTIEDAQLIRIMRNKVILIRSNGQQETLYVTPQDAEVDQYFLHGKDWSLIVEQISPTSFIVDPEQFVVRVRSIAHAIEMLNITTVYSKGKSIGCRLGKQQEGSLAHILGLMVNDIIMAINQQPVATVDERLTAYQHIISAQLGQKITVDILRNQQPMKLEYQLQTIERGAPASPPAAESKTASAPTALMKSRSTTEVEEEKRKILEKKHKFAPTLEEIKKQEKRAIITSAQRSPNKRVAQANGIQKVEHTTMVSG